MVLNENPIIEMKNIAKAYGAVQALDDIHFWINPNEVIGLVGDNGAGKSTLIKILSGIIRQDKGDIYYNGQKYKIESHRDSYAIGIETIYQDVALIGTMNILRNIFLGREEVNGLGFMRIKNMKVKSMDVLKHSIGISGILSPDQIVKNLSGGQKQAVAIARAVYFKKKMLLLDEPTSALSVKETQLVLNYILNLKNEGISCVFVTHNLYHVYQVADRFVILSRGRKIADIAKKDTTIKQLSNIIVEN
jgi:simple sugar transport system ATP-binding protein